MANRFSYDSGMDNLVQGYNLGTSIKSGLERDARNKETGDILKREQTAEFTPENLAAYEKYHAETGDLGQMGADGSIVASQNSNAILAAPGARHGGIYRDEPLSPDAVRATNRADARTALGAYGSEGAAEIHSMDTQDAAAEGLVTSKRENEIAKKAQSKADAIDKENADLYSTTHYAKNDAEYKKKMAEWNSKPVAEQMALGGAAPVKKEYTHGSSLLDEATMAQGPAKRGDFSRMSAAMDRLQKAQGEGEVQALQMIYAGGSREAIAAEYNKHGVSTVDPADITLSKYITKDSEGKAVEGIRATIKSPSGGPDSVVNSYEDMQALLGVEKIFNQANTRKETSAKTLTAEASMVSANKKPVGGSGAAGAKMSRMTDADGNIYMWDGEQYVNTATEQAHDPKTSGPLHLFSPEPTVKKVPLPQAVVNKGQMLFKNIGEAARGKGSWNAEDKAKEIERTSALYDAHVRSNPGLVDLRTPTAAPAKGLERPTASAVNPSSVKVDASGQAWKKGPGGTAIRAPEHDVRK